ncbi:hypothetical protein [Flagellimonas flava]|uniref:hypothetical protein n=1 Tax=Flagellimonas flava TaxID=570519 RepID=UPI003D658CB7
MILGYGLFGPDNGSHLYPIGNGRKICDVLDYVKNRQNYLSEEFKVSNSSFDFSFTYDSALIVSQKFRDFCLRNQYDGLSFYPVPSQKGLYLFKSSNEVLFDTEKRHTKFIDYQEKCKRHDSVVGATPIFIKDNTPLQEGIFRTDVEFGSGYEQSPLILIGELTHQKMKMEKFNSLEFEIIQSELRFDF